MDFAVIDVETANPALSSICQVGVAIFTDGALSDSWGTLVNPHEHFDPYYVAVHGITADMVTSAPDWSFVNDRLISSLTGQIVASHTPFDRTALRRACEKHSQPLLDCRWIDSARVVRRVWPAFSKAGYGLANLSKHFGIEFQHHNAEEDARATGEILLRAIQESGSTAAEWCSLSLLSSSKARISVAHSANPDGPLYGHVVVFTGTLSIPRQEAASLAAQAGCEVAAGVTKSTTLIVVGDQDIRLLAGADKSAKHRKAEELIKNGQDIRVLGESDFAYLISSAPDRC
jgi:DNA polymerase-3 subunit epsilon